MGVAGMGGGEVTGMVKVGVEGVAERAAVGMEEGGEEEEEEDGGEEEDRTTGEAEGGGRVEGEVAGGAGGVTIGQSIYQGTTRCVKLPG